MIGANPGIGLVVLALLVLRQVRPRPAFRRRRPIVTTVIFVAGVLQLAGFTHHHGLDAWDIAAVGASVLLAAAMGAVRAATVHLWVEQELAVSLGSQRYVVWQRSRHSTPLDHREPATR